MRLNPLLVSLSLRATRRLLVLSLLLPALVLLLEWTRGPWPSLDGFTRWLFELAPATILFALADLFSQLRRERLWLGARTLGLSPRWLIGALILPAILFSVAATVASLSALPALRQRHAPAPPPVTAPGSCAVPSEALLSAPQPLRDVACRPHAPAPDARALRRMSWSELSAHEAGGERLRRLLEPWLGLLLALPLLIALSRGRPRPRALTLLATTLTLVLGHAIWSLLLL